MYWNSYGLGERSPSPSHLRKGGGSLLYDLTQRWLEIWRRLRIAPVRVLAVGLEPGVLGGHELVLVVDRFPSLDRFIYEKRQVGGERAYFAERDGFASFFLWTGIPGDGYLRRLVKLASGRWEKVIGGAPSRPSVMEGVGFPASLPCTLRLASSEATSDWHITVDRACEVIAAHRAPIVIDFINGYWEAIPA